MFLECGLMQSKIYGSVFYSETYQGSGILRRALLLLTVSVFLGWDEYIPQ